MQARMCHRLAGTAFLWPAPNREDPSFAAGFSANSWEQSHDWASGHVCPRAAEISRDSYTHSTQLDHTHEVKHGHEHGVT
eukprot:14736472-Alexandrium_andersonii.AAC.1